MTQPLTLSTTEILEVVMNALVRHSGVSSDQIDPDKQLSGVPGIESVKALRAVTDVEDALGIVIPDDFLFETATVRELAQYVADLVSKNVSGSSQ